MNLDRETPSQDPMPTPSMPARAVVILICGLLATWLAGGSLGWIAPPLQKTLTWLALAIIVLLALGGRGAATRADDKGSPWAKHDRWLLFAAAAIAVVMTASSLAVVNILAVAVLLAVVALVRPGTIALAAGPVALAATTLAVFHILCQGTASGWALADTVGRAEGHWATLLTGRPLLIGASFGGVDFLVVMAALAVAQYITLRAHPASRDGYACRRLKWAAAAALAIAAAQTAYLVVLAFTHDLTALLPPPARPIDTSLAHMGVWTWSDAARAMLPWHLPVLAAVFQTAVAVCVFLAAPRPAPVDDAPEAIAGMSAESKRRDRRIAGNPAAMAGKVRPQAAWMLFAPAGLLLVAAAAAGFAPVKPDLSGKRIVAYDDGTLDWTTADPGNVAPGLVPRYGLLPALVTSLGGEFVVSKDLHEGDLRDADVLIVLPPGKPSDVSAEISDTVTSMPAKIGTVSRRNARGSPPENLGLRQCGRQARCGGRAGEPRRHRRQCAERAAEADRDVVPRRHSQFAHRALGMQPVGGALRGDRHQPPRTKLLQHRPRRERLHGVAGGTAAGRPLVLERARQRPEPPGAGDQPAASGGVALLAGQPAGQPGAGGAAEHRPRDRRRVGRSRLSEQRRHSFFLYVLRAATGRAGR